MITTALGYVETLHAFIRRRNDSRILASEFNFAVSRLRPRYFIQSRLWSTRYHVREHLWGHSTAAVLQHQYVRCSGFARILGLHPYIPKSWRYCGVGGLGQSTPTRRRSRGPSDSKS